MISNASKRRTKPVFCSWTHMCVWGKSNNPQVHSSSASSLTCGELFVISGDSLPQKHLVMCPSMTVPLTETMAWAALSWLENLQDKQSKAQLSWLRTYKPLSLDYQLWDMLVLTSSGQMMQQTRGLTWWTSSPSLETPGSPWFGQKVRRFVA